MGSVDYRFWSNALPMLQHAWPLYAATAVVYFLIIHSLQGRDIRPRGAIGVALPFIFLVLAPVVWTRNAASWMESWEYFWLKFGPGVMLFVVLQLVALTATWPVVHSLLSTAAGLAAAVVLSVWLFYAPLPAVFNEFYQEFPRAIYLLSLAGATAGFSISAALTLVTVYWQRRSALFQTSSPTSP